MLVISMVLSIEAGRLSLTKAELFSMKKDMIVEAQLKFGKRLADVAAIAMIPLSEIRSSPRTTAFYTVSKLSSFAAGMSFTLSGGTITLNYKQNHIDHRRNLKIVRNYGFLCLKFV